MRDIVLFYKKERSIKLAEKLFLEIELSVSHLAEFPEMGTVEALLNNCAKVYRSLVVTEIYKIIYYIEKDKVFISDIWDCRRDPETYQQKIKKNE